jgi:Lrp/AsnC family transcriptional regulator for asnA, asnC and gidA
MIIATLSTTMGRMPRTNGRGATTTSDPDELDRKIMDMLLHDPRLPSTQIARQLSVPEATVRYRIRRMRDQGRMVSMTMPNNVRALRATFFVRTVPSKAEQLIADLSENPQVAYMAVGSGTYDLFLHATFDDEDAFLTFRNRTLGSSDAVSAMECLQFVKIIHRLYPFTGFPS